MRMFFPVASVVTEKAWKEFLLLKFSFEQYHSAEWFLSCDKHVEERLTECSFDNVDFEVNIDHDDCTHNTTDEEQREQWLEVMLTKFPACRRAIDNHQGSCLFLDSDMVFVNPIDDFIIQLSRDCFVDAMVCPHMTNNQDVENKHGYYNAGMFFVNNLQLLDDWETISKDHKKYGLYFEQQPLEYVIRGYRTANLPINYNFGWWRTAWGSAVSRISQIKLADEKICFRNLPVVNFHMHTLKTKKTDAFSNNLVAHVFELLRESNNVKYKALVKYFEGLKGQT